MSVLSIIVMEDLKHSIGDLDRNLRISVGQKKPSAGTIIQVILKFSNMIKNNFSMLSYLFIFIFLPKKEEEKSFTQKTTIFILSCILLNSAMKINLFYVLWSLHNKLFGLYFTYLIKLVRGSLYSWWMMNHQSTVLYELSSIN